MSLGFTGERIVPGAPDCEPTFAQKMYQEHLARYAFAAQFAQGRDVLDVGCGVGYGSQWLGKSGARSVLGIDISAEAVEHAQHNYFHPVVRFRAQDASAIEAEGGYDLVTCFELIEHIEQQALVLDRIKAALRPNGQLVISTPRPLDDIRTHFHVHEMSFEELFDLLKQRFAHVEAFFEVNCFTSYVGKESPSRLDRILPISDRINLANADYFVFVASDTPLDEREAPSPILTLNDDSYILTLEKDIEVLRGAENYHLQQIATLETERHDLTEASHQADQKIAAISEIRGETSAIRATVEDMRQQLGQLTDVGALREDAARAAFLDAEIARVRTEMSELRTLLLETQNRLAKSEGDAHASLAAKTFEAEALQREAAHLRSNLAMREGELDNVRRVLADNGNRVAELQTEANGLRSEVARLPEMTRRCSDLESEMNAMRYRLDYAESTLTRFRRSLSWKLTKPIRWIGRTFKKLTGGGKA